MALNLTTPYEYSANDSLYNSVCFLDNDTAVIAYRGTSFGYCSVIIAQKSGSTWTGGIPTVVLSQNTSGIDVVKIDATHFAISYYSTSPSTVKRIRTYSVSGTTITPISTVNHSLRDKVGLLLMSSSRLVAYGRNNGLNIAAELLSIDGSYNLASLDVGADTASGTLFTDPVAKAHSSTEFVYTARDLRIGLFDITGDTVAFQYGDSTSVGSGLKNYDIFVRSATTGLWMFEDASNLYAWPYTLSGSSFTLGSLQTETTHPTAQTTDYTNNQSRVQAKSTDNGVYLRSQVPLALQEFSISGTTVTWGDYTDTEPSTATSSASYASLDVDTSGNIGYVHAVLGGAEEGSYFTSETIDSDTISGSLTIAGSFTDASTPVADTVSGSLAIACDFNALTQSISEISGSLTIASGFDSLTQSISEITGSLVIASSFTDASTAAPDTITGNLNITLSYEDEDYFGPPRVEEILFNQVDTLGYTLDNIQTLENNEYPYIIQIPTSNVLRRHAQRDLKTDSGSIRCTWTVHSNNPVQASDIAEEIVNLLNNNPLSAADLYITGNDRPNIIEIPSEDATHFIAVVDIVFHYYKISS